MFRPVRNWFYRADLEFTDQQLTYYRLARVITILFALTLVFLSLLIALKSFKAQNWERSEAFFGCLIFIYALVVLYPNRFIKSNISFHFKFIGLECGCIWMLNLSGSWMIDEVWSWSSKAIGGLTFLLTLLAWSTTKTRFRNNL